MKEQVKELRIKIDGLAQLTKGLNPLKIYDVGVVPARHFGNHTTEIGYREYMGNSKEIEKAVDSLYLAKAWLGKVLGELGESTPYANDGKRKTVEDIEPTADVNDEVPFGDEYGSLWRDKNHIEKTDLLRQEIKTVIGKIPDYSKWIEEQIDNFYKVVKEDSKEDFYNKEEEFMSKLPNLEFEFDLIYKYLSEAKFWLGFELQRIKEGQ